MRVKVLLPLPLDGPLDYLAPDDWQLRRGSLVVVPLGPRRLTGAVWMVEARPSPTEFDAAKLKNVEAQLDLPALPESLTDLVDWLASYSVTAPGLVLRLVLRSSQALEAPIMRTAYIPTGHAPQRLTPARRRVLALLEDQLPRTAPEIAEAAGVSPGVIKGLAEQGALERVRRPVDLPFDTPDPAAGGVTLSPSQRRAADALVQRTTAQSFSVTLLNGVPGSGKTETYFEAIAAALRCQRQVLVLLPEIALTVPFLDRFAARFGCRPAVWHSEMSAKERRRTWRGVATGKVRALVGARSALFLPFSDLGLIVVDEEHDSAFKQEDGVIYHARDIAVVRASLANIPAILSSATPSLETVVNVDQGRYHQEHLVERHGGAHLPTIEAVDMRCDGPEPGNWLSPRVVRAVKDTLQRDEQALLFLNRRGYAPLTLCRSCGHRMRAPDTSSWLVEHRFSNRLICHHSGFSMAKPDACPNCGTKDALVGCGPGVERVAEEAAKIFPDANVAVISSDTLRGPAAVGELMQRMQEGDIDLLVGTQIVAKGYHFPNLTFVGIVDADLGLAGGDLRAAERTFQLLSQVAGRAGRAERPGHVLLQTYNSESPVIDALVRADREAFLSAEADARRAFGLPPFGRLAALVVASRDSVAAEEAGKALARLSPSSPGVEVFGPAPAPHAVLRGWHRYRLLVKARRDINIQAFISAWLPKVDLPRQVRLKVDIDPYSFL